MVFVKKNLLKIGADLHSLAMDSHGLDFIIRLKLIYQSRAVILLSISARLV